MAAGALLAAALSAGLPAAPAGAQLFGPLGPRDMLLYREAFQAAAVADWETVRTLTADVTDPLLVPVLDWMAMSSETAGVSFQDIRRFIDRYPDWPGLAAIRARAEQAMPDSLPPAEVAAWYEATPPGSVDGMIRQVMALDALGRQDEATRALRDRWPLLSLNEEGQNRLLAQFGSRLTAEDHWRRLDRMLWEERNFEAQRMMSLVSPERRLLAQARSLLANQGAGVDAAVRAVPAQLQSDPGLIYERVRWRRRADLTPGAVELLGQQPEQAAYADRWWLERAILIRRLIEARDFRGAYGLAARHGHDRGLPMADGEWLAGFMALRFLNDAATAFRHFQTLHANVGTPISLSRGAYWSGRAAEAMGDQQTAARWYAEAARYPTVFYGQLAAGRLGRPSVAGLPADPAPSEAERQAFANDTLVRIVRGLVQVDQMGRADVFLFHLVQQAETPERLHLVGELAQDLGRLRQSVLAGKRAATTGAQLITVSYPTMPIAGGDNRAERALTLALIRQESEFDQTAISRAGAMGLMQLMPATARSLAGRLGVSNSTTLLTLDVNHNVLLGTTYLGDMLDRFGGSYPLAIAAYNAGPGRVDQWLREFGDPRQPSVDMLDWLELIPIAETRNYVQRVLENTQIYRVRLGEQPRVGMLETDLGY